MRKVIVLEFITLDGVIQAGGGPEEDPSGGFAYGGWQAPYSDDVLGTVMNRQMNMPFDLLLGRTTFEIWAAYWPHHADIWPGVNPSHFSLVEPLLKKAFRQLASSVFVPVQT